MPDMPDTADKVELEGWAALDRIMRKVGGDKDVELVYRAAWIDRTWEQV
jgi:hypothetical protein